MASSALDAQDQPAPVGEKRKREADDIDSKDDYQQDGGHATVEPDSVVPENYEHSDDDSDDPPEDEDDEENVIEEISEIPSHDESTEPFPKCAVYDDETGVIQERITAILQQVLDGLEEHGCLSKAFKSHISKARKLCGLPKTRKLRIAILGCAGAGKSSLLNAITGKPDLAQSLSGGQSCTCVPTEYQAAFPNQKLDFAAKFYYLTPDGVKLQLRETVNDYYTFAFEAADDWDEDTRITAKKAHANAFRVLRTLFNDVEKFKSKVSTVGYMAAMYTQRDTLVEELANDCEQKLKHTATQNYTAYHETRTLAKLRTKIDPLMNSTGSFEEPSLWPLIGHVSIGVRDSRVLEKVTLVDLPGISDTNESRVELTHEFIGSCDYIWIVAPISRAVDDATVFQLLSRYGKLFKGMLCVICTHSDDGIIASETKLVNFFRQEDQDVAPYLALSDQMKAKKSEITALKAEIAKIKRKKKRATKQQMMDVREEEETLKMLTRDFARIEAERFAFLVQTRNALITEQMQDAMQSHLPVGHVLEVHCISNSHYAALNRVGIRGPRLTAEATGIPKLRANTIALMAARLLDTLERYITVDVKAMLQDLQLWLSTASSDRRAELLALASQPRDKLPAMFNARITSHSNNVLNMAGGALQQAIPEASKAALEQLAKKETRHAATIMAFIRNNGNHVTKMCPKESWNENFMKSLADVVISCLTYLGQTRLQLTEVLADAVIEDMNKFKESINGRYFFLLPGVAILTAF
jgi:GTPase SAR1 family protein